MFKGGREKFPYIYSNKQQQEIPQIILHYLEEELDNRGWFNQAPCFYLKQRTTWQGLYGQQLCPPTQALAL